MLVMYGVVTQRYRNTYEKTGDFLSVVFHMTLTCLSRRPYSKCFHVGHYSTVIYLHTNEYYSE